MPPSPIQGQRWPEHQGLAENSMPRSGDVMVHIKDTTLGQIQEFDAQFRMLDIPSEISVGHSPAFGLPRH